MSDAVLQATIRAYDEFSQQFKKLQEELKKTQQEQKNVKATSDQVNKALSDLVVAKNRARQASEQFNKVLQDMSRGEKSSADSTARLGQAFEQLAQAERQLQEQTKITNQTLKDYNLTSKEIQAVMREMDGALGNRARGHEDVVQWTVQDYMQTMALTSALYAYKQGLADVIETGREYELTLKHVMAVTGDFTDTLGKTSMASQGGSMGMFTPTELAVSYRELGQAGATTNEILSATPEIMEFATAAMLDTEKASYGVLAAAKSFNVELTNIQPIVDAYTETMNEGALAGEDFQWIMSSAGAVAKMAGQDFTQVLAIGSVMRDAGIQAQDAGTSIKSALMSLMDPSTEAREIIKDLGIDIYDASGKMKQWSDITKEFEEALGPYNEKSRQFILTTIFGSDGIRAMATSLNKGSGFLQTFSDDLKNAEGATEKMAKTMSESFDGSIRRTNSSLEKLKIHMFQDIETPAASLIDVVNTLATGFNSLDEGTRQLVEALVGGMGLVIAIKTVIQIASMMGITLTSLLNPTALIIAAVATLTGGLLLYKGSQEAARLETEQSVKAKVEEANHLETLTQRYEELRAKTDLSKQEEAEMKKITQELADTLPGARDGFDSMGNAILNMGNASEEARKKLHALRQEAINNAEINANIAKAQMPELQNKQNEAKNRMKTLSEYMSSGNYTGAMLDSRTGRSGWQQISALWKSDSEVALEVGNLANKAKTDYTNASNEIKQAQEALRIFNSLKAGKDPFKPVESKKPSSNYKTSGGTGGQEYNPPEKENERQNKALKAAKSITDQVKDALWPYRAAAEAAGQSVNLLGRQEQYLEGVMKSGVGTMKDTIDLNKVRTEQLKNLEVYQKELGEQANAERAKIVQLTKAYHAATDPAVMKEYRTEIEGLQGSIDKASQAWWQAQNSKIKIISDLKAEEKKAKEDSFKNAMDKLKFEVETAQMSADQQIKYLEKLRTAYNWTVSQMREIDEAVFKVRQSEAKKLIDTIEDAYKDKLQAIKDKAKRDIDDIQAKIDQLNNDKTDSDREDKEADHNKKIADLQEKRRYHELRTGKEHQEAIKEIDEEIAEENRKWQKEQNDWKIDDQIAALEEEKQTIQDNQQEEEEQLKEHYDELKDITEDGLDTTLAALGARSPEWFSMGQELINQLIQGLESGDFSSVQSQIENVRQGNFQNASTNPDYTDADNTPASSTKEPTWTIAKGQYTTMKNQSAMWSREIANLFGGLPVEYNQAKNQVSIGGKTFTPLGEENGNTYVGIRAVAEALGYKVGYDQKSGAINVYRAYATGGPVFEDGPAYLHAGEYVLNSSLVDSIRRADLPPKNLAPVHSNVQGTSPVDKAVAQLAELLEKKLLNRDFKGGDFIVNGPLWQTDRAYMGGELDAETAGRQLMKGAEQIKRGRGY